MNARGGRQGELFAGVSPAQMPPTAAALAPPLLRHQLRAWQQRLEAHQRPLLQAGPAVAGQGELFRQPGSLDAAARAAALDPLALQPQSLSFWRWPQAPQGGAAIYLVMDRPADGDTSLVLYVGETVAADRRWKGGHDCKRYLAAYGEALRRAQLPLALSIRFWFDVPLPSRERRALEQALIRRWLPPFNKETRERWGTPFTADPV